jgi:hypothetical protein
MAGIIMPIIANAQSFDNSMLTPIPNNGLDLKVTTQTANESIRFIIL